MFNESMGRKRVIAMILALVLIIGGAVGGTLAWLISETDPVVNTFTYGDIDLELDETKIDEEGNPVDEDKDGKPDTTTKGNDYEMIPGEEYLKDPKVTVLKDNETCWLFVKLDENGGVTIVESDGTSADYEFDDYLTYEVAEGWTPLLDAEEKVIDGVYFRKVDEDTDGKEVDYEILKDNKITVKDTVNKEMLNALDNNGQDKDNATYPSLSITAYAIQHSGFEPEVTDGAEKPTIEQINAAALLAWQHVEAQNTTANP